jgi:transforming growth factor-beta-induced protein
MKRSRVFNVLTMAVGIYLALFGSVASMGGESVPKDIIDTVIETKSLKTFLKSLKAADLVEVLKGKGPFTVFAPTDQAFAKLPAGVLDDLLKSVNKVKLKDILTCHVVSSKLIASDLTLSHLKTTNLELQIMTLQGQMLPVSVSGSTIMVDNAKVIKTDIICSNGVLHIVDAVILPE